MLRSSTDAKPHLAARCAFLRVTMGHSAGGNLVNLCQHIVREGSECVGPFLDDHETTCGLWEEKPPEPHTQSRASAARH
jgi:hypothetical protein